MKNNNFSNELDELDEFFEKYENQYYTYPIISLYNFLTYIYKQF